MRAKCPRRTTKRALDWEVRDAKPRQSKHDIDGAVDRIGTHWNHVEMPWYISREECYFSLVLSNIVHRAKYDHNQVGDDLPVQNTHLRLMYPSSNMATGIMEADRWYSSHHEDI